MPTLPNPIFPSPIKPNFPLPKTPVVEELILLGFGADPAALPFDRVPFVWVDGQVADRTDDG